MRKFAGGEVFSFGHGDCRTGHAYRTLLVGPVDAQNSATKVDIDGTFKPTAHYAGYCSGAGASAACQSLTLTAFPYSHFHIMRIDDAGEFYICLFRPCMAAFEARAKSKDIGI